MKTHNTSTQWTHSPSGGGSIAHAPIIIPGNVTCLWMTNGRPGIRPFAAPKRDDGGRAERRRKDGKRRDKPAVKPPGQGD